MVVFCLYTNRGCWVLNPVRSQYLWMLLVSPPTHTMVLRVWFCTICAIQKSPCYSSCSFCPLLWCDELLNLWRSNLAAYWKGIFYLILLWQQKSFAITGGFVDRWSCKVIQSQHYFVCWLTEIAGYRVAPLVSENQWIMSLAIRTSHTPYEGGAVDFLRASSLLKLFCLLDKWFSYTAAAAMSSHLGLLVQFSWLLLFPHFQLRIPDSFQTGRTLTPQIITIC